MEPRAATPVEMPTWRNVELMPEAIPARRGSTTPTAVEASGGLTIPAPTPATRKPGISTVHDDEALSRAIRNRPTATSNRPPPIRSRTGTRCVSRPEMVAATMSPAEMTRRRTPVPRAE